ncbi:MAG: helix-turn-helix transcriptional regulator [Clostridia bacterium]|nr:helix-turn-helix transcriptional regulator [Clostridia bacterium]
MASKSSLDYLPESISGNYNRVTGPGMKSAHHHTQYEMSIVTQGRLTIYNNDDVIKTDAPCVILHFPGTYHYIATDPEICYERYNINYSAEIFGSHPAVLNDTELLYTANVSVIQISPDTLEELLYYVHPFMRAKFDYGRQTALLCVILNILKSSRPLGGFAGHSSANYVNSVIRYISDNLSPTMTADQIAADFYISRAKLAGDFKRETGMTLKQYIELQCVERAKMELAAGKNVHTVSADIGWANVGTFIRAFKKLTGSTPGSYGTPHEPKGK